MMRNCGFQSLTNVSSDDNEDNRSSEEEHDGGYLTSSRRHDISRNFLDTSPLHPLNFLSRSVFLERVPENAKSTDKP